MSEQIADLNINKPSKGLYLLIGGKKYYIDDSLAEKYKLQKGQITPFTRILIMGDLQGRGRVQANCCSRA